ncbi:LLM class flavin-dependent oxidoreductase [Deinococcus sonorensis]|uniref:LLM class flavin-dependent oxidoreductase n=2 Tax=Deinococcus sonorensis TaxID=309891 RepID=A0AAU7U983_9DEIO
MTLPLSVLDLSPVPSGSSGAQALQRTLDLARFTDRLGYTRYWMAEHHNMASVVSSAPEVLLGALATQTRRIRIGSGGIMLPNHSPLKVAETFRTLAGLAPGRVDLGLGRAPGTDQVTALALRRNQEAVYADDFPQQLAYLRAFSGEGEFPDGHPFARVQASPVDVPLPPLYLLSSSGYSARLAAQLGLGFAFAHHFSPAAAAESMQMYRDEFQPSEAFPEPHAILTVAAAVADTDEEADHLARTLDLMTLNIRSGRRSPLPSPEEALAYPYSPAELAFVQANRRNQFIGTPDVVRERLLALATDLQADELMITTNLHSHEARKHSYALLARAFGLQEQATAELVSGR